MSKRRRTKVPSEHAEPPAGAMVEALRGIGYSLPTAIADLIDNSVSAEATTVHITFWWQGRDSFISILDNGKGMSEAELRAAMRPGSRNPLEEREPTDLGRFGLGLKTASFSQCRRLTVSSKTSAGTAIRRWDLDYVRDEDAWLLLLEPAPGSGSRMEPLRHFSSGTLVLWEVLDRVVGDAPVGDRLAHDRFLLLAAEAEAHLGMVFHRYLEGGRPELRIFLNNQPIKPWDPFLSLHGATFSTPEEPISWGTDQIQVRGFVLPHKDRMTEQEWERAAGPSGWNAQQGFYVYRNRRLLVAGGWLGLGLSRPWVREEHYRLARIRLDIPNSMDQAWKIDVKKSTARPPDALRPRLRDLAEQVRKRAREVFAYRGRQGARGPVAPIDRAWLSLSRGGRLTYRVNRQHPVVQLVMDRAGDLAPDVESLLRVVEETVPVQQIWLDAAEKPDSPAAPFAADPDVQRVMTRFYRSLRRQGRNAEQSRAQIRQTEPFNEYPDLIAALPDEP